MSKIYLEIFDDKRKETFKKLAEFTTYGYLAGGTALALQINHRRSVDFDMFVHTSIDTNLRLMVKKVFGAVDFFVDSGDQISFITRNGISVTFLWYYFPSAPLVKTTSIPLASVPDIAASKAQTLGRRAVWRDYADLFYLMKHNIMPLADIIKEAKRKFAGEFNEALFLEQLAYFSDVTVQPIDWIDTPYTPEEIKAFLETEVRTYLAKQLS